MAKGCGRGKGYMWDDRGRREREKAGREGERAQIFCLVVVLFPAKRVCLSLPHQFQKCLFVHTNREEVADEVSALYRARTVLGLVGPGGEGLEWREKGRFRLQCYLCPSFWFCCCSVVGTLSKRCRNVVISTSFWILSALQPFILFTARHSCLVIRSVLVKEGPGEGVGKVAKKPSKSGSVFEPLRGIGIRAPCG